MNDTLFKNIIGQDAAKKKLGFYLKSYEHTHIFPNMLLCAPKGQGKTTLARETARGLVQFNEEGKPLMVEDPKNPGKQKIKKKTFIEVNCSTLKNVKQFMNSLIVQNVVDKDVTVLFDEASEIPHSISMALLTILNPNPEARTTFAYEEFVCDFDFRHQSFMFCTSEPQSVFHALRDRLIRVDLEEYTPEQVAKIVQKGCPDVDFEDDVLLSIATVLRGNARQAQMMAENIRQYLCKKTKFTKKHWKDLRDILSIYPLGLNDTEVNILRFIGNAREGIPLTGLAAKTGLSRDAVQKDYEMYLQKHGLMEIETTGRMITPKGVEYLKILDGKAPSPSSGIVQ